MFLSLCYPLVDHDRSPPPRSDRAGNRADLDRRHSKNAGGRRHSRARSRRGDRFSRDDGRPSEDAASEGPRRAIGHARQRGARGRNARPRHTANRSPRRQPVSVRSNRGDVTVVVDPDDYALVLAELRENGGATTLALRRKLAAKAYARTAVYDAAISNWFADQLSDPVPAFRAVGGH